MAPSKTDPRNSGEEPEYLPGSPGVTDAGTIRGPGKFEGEPYYVPYYWDVANSGAADEELFDGEIPVSIFKLDSKDRHAFGFDKGEDELWLWEREDGFVLHRLLSTKKADELREELEEAPSDDSGDDDSEDEGEVP